MCLHIEFVLRFLQSSCPCLRHVQEGHEKTRLVLALGEEDVPLICWRGEAAFFPGSEENFPCDRGRGDGDEVSGRWLVAGIPALARRGRENDGPALGWTGGKTCPISVWYLVRDVLPLVENFCIRIVLIRGLWAWQGGCGWDVQASNFAPLGQVLWVHVVRERFVHLAPSFVFRDKFAILHPQQV